MILAFSGSSGSGKTTVSELVSVALGWKRGSFGDYVRHVAQSREEPGDTPHLQDLGQGLVEASPEGLVQAVLRHFEWDCSEPLVLDGVRHAEILRALVKLARPARVRLVLLKVDDTERRARLARRDSTEMVELEKRELHSVEKQVASELLAEADLVLDGTRAVDDLVAEISEWAAS